MFRILCLTVMITLSALPPAMAQQVKGLEFPGLIQRLHTDFAFTEGPAVDAEGNLYFTDIPNNRIHKRNRRGKLTVFVEPSGHCNGLMVVGNSLLACAMDGQLKQFSLGDGSEQVLADKYNGIRFNAPNDLVIDRTGGIYFTDPRYRAPDPWPQGTEAVYYRSPSGEVTRLIDDREAPNGIILSPDESVLYVIPSKEKEMWAYPVSSPGKLGDGRVLCELTQRDNAEWIGGGDGLTIDTNGNLYITTELGLQVFDPQGQQLGIIEFPEHPANVTFGGRGRQTLLVTARKSLYLLRTSAVGHVFPGQKFDEAVAE